MLDAALAYAKRGWPIFPARADKTPYTANGVNDATTDPRQIKAWWGKWPMANIALDVGGANMMVVDLDPGHNQEELEKNVGTLPETKLRARTPRGGYHLYFALGAGEVVPPSVGRPGAGLANHVDVRSFHSYVLLAPSRTGDGNYAWDSEGKPAFRSDALLQKAQEKAREKSEHSDVWLIEQDLPENIASAITWLKDKAKIAVEGHGGDNETFATAAMCKSFGLSPEMAFDLIWEHWNPRCSPPWDADELQRKVENGYSYNTSPPGNMTPAYHVAKTQALFKARDIELPSGRQKAAGRFRMVDREGMEHILPPKWIIDNFLPEQSYAIMFGAPGTYKTFVALDIALEIACGFCVDPLWEVNEPGAVLFAVGEGRPNLRQRVMAWERLHYGEGKVRDFILADPVPSVGIADDLTAFIGMALELYPEGYKLVVLDTVSRVLQGLNENAQEHVSKLTAMVERLQTELGCAVLALHHTGHGTADREQGSTVFGRDTDTRIMLTREQDQRVALTVIKQKDGETWKQPRFIELPEVVFGPKNKTLAAMPGQASVTVIPAGAEALIVNSAKMRDADSMFWELMCENPTRTDWKDGQLCEALGRRMNIKTKSFRQRYMDELKVAAGSHMRRCFNPEGSPRWRYVAPKEGATGE